jgi:hypothetical protein
MPECCGLIWTLSVQLNYKLGFWEQVPLTCFFRLVKIFKFKTGVMVNFFNLDSFIPKVPKKLKSLSSKDFSLFAVNVVCLQLLWFGCTECGFICNYCGFETPLICK